MSVRGMAKAKLMAAGIEVESVKDWRNRGRVLYYRWTIVGQRLGGGGISPQDEGGWKAYAYDLVLPPGRANVDLGTHPDRGTAEQRLFDYLRERGDITITPNKG